MKRHALYEPELSKYVIRMFKKACRGERLKQDLLDEILEWTEETKNFLDFMEYKVCPKCFQGCGWNRAHSMIVGQVTTSNTICDDCLDAGFTLLLLEFL